MPTIASAAILLSVGLALSGCSKDRAILASTPDGSTAMLDDGGSSTVGGGSGQGASDGSGANAGTGEGGNPGPPAGCVPGGPQCNNCVDDDGDGLVDGADPECTGPSDNIEASFSTGIPGDNIDPVFQDCFFDGNSGHEDDGCKRPTCCLIDANAPGCPPVPAAATCESSPKCVDTCAPLVPPGCDCFGCCTVCNGTICADVAIGLTSMECTRDTLADPTQCPRCIKDVHCGSDCTTDPCVLCPGETELPAECEAQACPQDLTPCSGGGSCGEGAYCSNGCCIVIVQ